MKTLQATFNSMVARQEWYAMSFEDKVGMLCNKYGKEFIRIASKVEVEITTHRKLRKQKSLAEVKFNPAKRVRKSFSRLVGTVLLPQVIKTQAAYAAANLLRTLGREVDITTSVQEVLSLNISELVWKMKEEAVQTAYTAFMAVAV